MLKDRALKAVKRDAVFKLRMCKGHRLPVEGIRKGSVPFLSKLAYKEQGVGPSGGASPDKTRVSTPRGFSWGTSQLMHCCVC